MSTKPAIIRYLQLQLLAPRLKGLTKQPIHIRAARRAAVVVRRIIVIAIVHPILVDGIGSSRSHCRSQSKLVEVEFIQSSCHQRSKDDTQPRELDRRIHRFRYGIKIFTGMHIKLREGQTREGHSLRQISGNILLQLRQAFREIGRTGAVRLLRIDRIQRLSGFTTQKISPPGIENQTAILAIRPLWNAPEPSGKDRNNHF